MVVYKGKGDALDCGNYRELRLLEHSMKVWEKVLEARLREIIAINENQLGNRQKHNGWIVCAEAIAR